jgi:hypothetical protein
MDIMTKPHQFSCGLPPIILHKVITRGMCVAHVPNLKMWRFITHYGSGFGSWRCPLPPGVRRRLVSSGGDNTFGKLME